ncbi:enhanced serine sensitivity protein SseB [Paenibacillus sp. DYY-L-2]|uniref:enhanced serine sensitivity protein SseB n=1 Tax=Paenibacillus sp. DYY-L-2 TaxID=3447013 RepID=UPI003F4F8593
MNEAHKDEIGRKYLLGPQVSAEECGRLTIQELIFLIHSGKYFKEKEAFPAVYLDERLKLFRDVLKDKIRGSEELYIAYDKRTGYPYTDGEDRVWVFSKEEYASNAGDYFMQQLMMLEMKRIGGEEIDRMLAELHILGLPKILVDNGQYHAVLDRDELLPPPDFSGTPEINIPVTNPGLQHALIRFFQEMNSGRNFEGKPQLMRELEGQMLDEVLRAKYLLPMQLIEKEPAPSDEQGMKTLKEGTVIQFAVLGGEGDSTWLPAFTDWPEFEKAYDKTVWSSNVVTYEDLLALSDKMDGVVINYRGIPLRLDEKNKQRIEAFKKERTDSPTIQPSEEKAEAEKDAASKLGEPPAYPAQMVEAVKEYMKTQKDIKKAYIRLAIKDHREMSYFMIVDADGDMGQIFKDIAEVASPHLNGMPLEIAALDTWEEELKDLEPFYKRKRFGLL